MERFGWSGISSEISFVSVGDDKSFGDVSLDISFCSSVDEGKCCVELLVGIFAVVVDGGVVLIDVDDDDGGGGRYFCVVDVGIEFVVGLWVVGRTDVLDVTAGFGE